MTQLWLPLIAVVAGFAGLIWSADRFVAGSAALAYNLGISKLIIGLTIVAFGTSAPEIVVSISASLKQAGELAVGNALGSNLANMGLVLAITVLVASLPIKRHLLSHEIPALLLITALAGIFLYDARLVTWEGGILLLTLPLTMSLLIWSRRADQIEEEAEIPSFGQFAAAGWFVLGLAALIASSEVLVWGATELALAFGVTPLVVGLTVIAVGTSLPELAASVGSALKGYQDIALGNIIGSNMFNLLAVMAIPGLLPQPPMAAEVFARDYIALALMTLVLAAAIYIGYWLRNRARRSGEPSRAYLGKIVGTTLLLCYLGYCYWLFVSISASKL